jgi:dUTP pyrophosphatase
MHFIVQDKNAQMPTRATEGSAGYDFYSPVSVALEPGESTIIDLGVSQCPAMIPIPKPYSLDEIVYFDNYPKEAESGYVLLLTIRSSLALKHSLRAINPIAVIDSDYTDTIKFGIANGGRELYTIQKGDRICQGVFVPFLTVDQNDIVINQKRTGGIGSTGK